MSANYGIVVIPDAQKNAINVILALWKGEDPSQSENVTQMANASGSSADPTTHWFGGRLYDDTDLAVVQNLLANLPDGNWPVVGLSGSVSLADAQAAATAMVVNVTTQDTFTSEQAQVTLSSVMQALGLQKVYVDI